MITITLSEIFNTQGRGADHLLVTKLIQSSLTCMGSSLDANDAELRESVSSQIDINVLF